MKKLMIALTLGGIIFIGLGSYVKLLGIIGCVMFAGVLLYAYITWYNK